MDKSLNFSTVLKSGKTAFDIFFFVICFSVFTMLFLYGINAILTRLSMKNTDLALLAVYCTFISGCIIYLKNNYRTRKYFKSIDRFKVSVEELKTYAIENNKKLPHIALFVPARNEGDVIGNTIRRLAKIDYPKEFCRIVVIVDERELDDDVEQITKDVVRETSAALEAGFGTEYISCIEVPKWYSGIFDDTTPQYEKSTKGRALNYALQILHTSPEWDAIDLIGVLDADGRLSTNVFKEVAWNYLHNNALLLQGPVFQISNIDSISIVGRVAGLELAVHHLTELAHRLVKGKFQFLAGTNYFIDKKMLINCGGWNQHALVEDAELAIRVYLTEKVTACWLSCPELEQSPPSFKIYLKQRERWARGHFDLLPDIINSKLLLRDKINFISKILSSQFRFIIDVGLPVIAYILIVIGAFKGLGSVFFGLSILLFCMSFVIWDTYGSMYRKLSRYIPGVQNSKFQMFKGSLQLFLFSPVMMLVQAIPRLSAIGKYSFQVQSGVWYKTERSKEQVVA